MAEGGGGHRAPPHLFSPRRADGCDITPTDVSVGIVKRPLLPKPSTDGLSVFFPCFVFHESVESSSKRVQLLLPEWIFPDVTTVVSVQEMRIRLSRSLDA